MFDFFNEALKGGLDSLTADQLDELIIMILKWARHCSGPFLMISCRQYDIIRKKFFKIGVRFLPRSCVYRWKEDLYG